MKSSLVFVKVDDNMTLGDLFHGTIGTLYTNVNQGIENTRFYELEQQLNEIFYPRDNGGNVIGEFARLQEAFMNEQGLMLKSAMDNFDINSFRTKVDRRGTGKTRESIEHALVAARQVRDEIANLDMSNATALEMSLKNAQRGISRAITYVEQVLNAISGGRFSAKAVDSTGFKYQTFRQNLAILENVSKYYGTYNMIELGNFFENALASLSGPFHTWVDGIGKDLINKVGQERVSRGSAHGLGLIYVSQIVWQTDQEGNNTQIVDAEASFNSGPVNARMTARFDAGAAKQGKVDVILQGKTMSGSAMDSATFKISAKNWHSSSGMLGETSILAAIDRTAGGANAESYAYAVNPYRNYVANAHKFAKLCIALDIALGVSQGSSAANCLVVNDRAHARIRVLSGHDLVQAIMANNSAARIIGYNEGAISQSALNILNAISHPSPGRSIDYLSSMYSYLAAYKVSIYVNMAQLGSAAN